jgi:hypothetical protein
MIAHWRRAMNENRLRCECGEWIGQLPEGNAGAKCPKCGRLTSEIPAQRRTMKEMLSDSALEATCDVMAEEGAIWSGAR